MNLSKKKIEKPKEPEIVPHRSSIKRIKRDRLITVALGSLKSNREPFNNPQTSEHQPTPTPKHITSSQVPESKVSFRRQIRRDVAVERRDLQEGAAVNGLVSGKLSISLSKEKTDTSEKFDGNLIQERKVETMQKKNGNTFSRDINESDPLLNLKITVTNKKRASPPSTSPSKRRRITNDNRSVVVTNDGDESTLIKQKSLRSTPTVVKNHDDEDKSKETGADGKVVEVDIQPVTQKVEIAPRCIFYPNCTKQNCPFFHPTEPCKNPVMCSFGPKFCRYIHPPCKFGSLCTRQDCVYFHPKEASIDCKDGFSCSVKSTCPYRHPSEACFFQQRCRNQGFCMFSHGFPCQFGAACCVPACTFSHKSVTMEEKESVILNTPQSIQISEHSAILHEPIAQEKTNSPLDLMLVDVN